MGQVVRRKVIVGPNGAIQLVIPELAPGATADVTVRVRTTGADESGGFSRWIGAAEGCFTTAGEVDAHVRNERDTWRD